MGPADGVRIAAVGHIVGEILRLVAVTPDPRFRARADQERIGRDGGYIADVLVALRDGNDDPVRLERKAHVVVRENGGPQRKLGLRLHVIRVEEAFAKVHREGVSAYRLCHVLNLAIVAEDLAERSIVGDEIDRRRVEVRGCLQELDGGDVVAPCCLREDDTRLVARL